MFSNLYGKEGVARMIYLLQTELGTSMKLMGESDVSAINSSYVSFQPAGYSLRAVLMHCVD